MTVKDEKKKSGPMFRKEERHELRYQLSVAIATTLSWFFFLVPAPLRNRFAEQCGLLFFRVSHTYRESVLRNIKQVLGKDEEDARVRAVARSIFKNSALNFMDLLTLPRRSNNPLLPMPIRWRCSVAASRRGSCGSCLKPVGLSSVTMTGTKPSTIDS